ncbi:redoxin domain-containing protein [Lacibacter luteus]|uniref:Redoxin domain-containing protein n=1 Tax=Lacibacter luteus TaxID=2508719 RepID=A0A4V1M723_9BACT|nr:redoxin domain-containing protein [Lacibacter luteus]RXK57859.1 redoxin domain-containing protein [Lacibacter luteus]
MKKQFRLVSLPQKSTASLITLTILFFLSGSFISSCKALQINSYLKSFSKYKSKKFPAIPLLDTAGNIVYLKSSSKSIMYVDMWTKNCIPCVSEFKKMPGLTQRFKGQNVEFVYICNQPASKKEWLSDIKKYGLEHGTHYYINDSLYQIYEKDILKVAEAYPTYHLLNTEGEFLGFEIPAPSDGFLTEYIISNGLKNKTAKESAKYVIRETSKENPDPGFTDWFYQHYGISFADFKLKSLRNNNE